ncbi:MAG: carboxylesterase family protein [Desulfobacteraceae bacterium]|nr:carboxylesterase family protein [Desulfobacteraceae bacterium]
MRSKTVTFLKQTVWLGIAVLLVLGVGIGNSLACKEKEKKHFPLTVHTKYGVVKGYYNTEETAAWKSVPFAKPPVGDLRWKAPQDPQHWRGVLDATQECEPCAQLKTDTNWGKEPVMVGSEDCLYLDIYRPKHMTGFLPVYVYFHGGANHFGGKSDYDGSVIAAKSQMVVVIVQQRLGPLGWFTHAALRHGESDLDDSGNYGTLDNIKALEWIHKNIWAFGGNPFNVTITGESAGAHNVMNMVISPLAKNLFHKAMSESGGMVTKTVEEGEAMAELIIDRILTMAGLSREAWNNMTLEEQEAFLRGLDAGQIWLPIIYDVPLMTFDAFEDGVVVPGSVTATIRSGNYNKVPIILGANKSEMKAFMPLYGPLLTQQSGINIPWINLIGVLQGYFPLDYVLPTEFDKKLYQVSGYYGSRNWRAKFVDERARALADQQSNVYAYQFNWGEPGSGPTPFDFIYGALHTLDIPFFFGADSDIWGYAFTPDTDTAGRQALRDAMMKYLANFARTGNPNGKGMPQWEQWSNSNGAAKAIVLDADMTQAKIGMSSEEVSIAAEQYKLAMEIATWTQLQQAMYGWVPWAFQWQTAE